MIEPYVTHRGDFVRVTFPRDSLVGHTSPAPGPLLVEMTRAMAEALLASLSDDVMAWEPLTVPEEPPAAPEPADGDESPRCVHCGVGITPDTTAALGWRHTATLFQLCNPMDPAATDRAEP